MDAKDNKLSVRICNKKPIELGDFTDCLFGVGQQYVRYLTKHPEVAEAKDIKLYVKEVRPGSTIADLVPLAPLAIPFIENANSIIGFAGYMFTIGRFLLGDGEKPDNLEKADYEHLNKITMPISKDRSAQFNLSAVINGTVDVNQTFNFGHVEANAMQNAISREIRALKEPVERIKKKVLLYWYQTRNDPKSKTGDMAIIESVANYPIKAIFAFDSLKHEMLVDPGENHFHFAYIVDVAVETIRDKPALYKIIEFHDKIPRPTSSDENGQGLLF